MSAENEMIRNISKNLYAPRNLACVEIEQDSALLKVDNFTLTAFEDVKIPKVPSFIQSDV